MINVRNQLSQGSQDLYDRMVAVMDHKGFLNWEACLELSVDGIELTGGHEGLKAILSELQREHLVFPHPDLSGWVVRFPLRACVPPTELP